MKFFILFLLSQLSFAIEQDAPSQVPSREEYYQWLGSINSILCPFNDKIFDWLDEQRGLSLPKEVYQNSDHLFVSVARPLSETIEMEEAGDIEAGITYGLETYGEIDAPVNTVLEAILFKWGKPIGQSQGTTYPMDTVYSYRKETSELKWGPNTYKTYTDRTGGGIAKDQHDSFSLVVRGDEQNGYYIFGSFLAPIGNTTTKSYISIMTLKQLPNGKTDFRVSGRTLGQSYAFLGIGYGRKNFGFNKERIRLGQKEFFDSVMELKRTGTIKERNFMNPFGVLQVNL